MREGVGAFRPLRAPQALAAGHRGFFLDVRLGQFGEETARDGAGPLAVDAAVGGMEDGCAAASAGDRHIGETALLLEAGETAFVERALRGNTPSSQPARIDDVELQALGGVDGHDCDAVALARLVIVHDQADMFEEGAEGFIFFHRARKLGEVFETAGAFRRSVGLEHRRVADSRRAGCGPVRDAAVPSTSAASGRCRRRNCRGFGEPVTSAHRCRAGWRRRGAAVVAWTARDDGWSRPPCRRGRAWAG